MKEIEIAVECGLAARDEPSAAPPQVAPLFAGILLSVVAGAAAALGGLHHRAGARGQPPLPPHRQARRRPLAPHHLRRPRAQGRQGRLVQVSEMP